MAPLLLQLLPRAGGLGERLGVLLSPFNLVSVLLAYLAAVTVDATGNYRLIWLFPAATGLGHAVVNCWLRYPERRSTSPDMVKRLWEWAVVQAESMAETGIVTGLLAAPLLGVVTEEDADSAVVVDMARNILGNPYEDVDDIPALPAGPAQDPSEGGSLGVTGVDQVGGGPAGDRENGDQKSGWGEESSSSSSATGADAESDPRAVTGVPATGVGSPTGDGADPSTVGRRGGTERGAGDGSDNSSGDAGSGPGGSSGAGEPEDDPPGAGDGIRANGDAGAGATGDAGAGATGDAGADPTAG
jgi:hypothetical protein